MFGSAAGCEVRLSVCSAVPPDVRRDLPLWQRRGTGLYWERVQKTGTNPLTQEVVSTQRRQLKKDLELPMRDEYDHLVRTLIAGALSE